MRTSGFVIGFLVLVLMACRQDVPPGDTTGSRIISSPRAEALVSPIATSTTPLPTASRATVTPHSLPPGAGPRPTATPVTTTYHGRPLPTPPVTEENPPPPAWFVIGEAAWPAVYGTRFYANIDAHAVPPELRDDLAPIAVALPTQPLVILGQGIAPITSVKAQMRPWIPDPSTSILATPTVAWRMLGTDVRLDQNTTVVTLESIDPVDDQVLEVHVTFAEGSDASYIWRLRAASGTK